MKLKFELVNGFGVLVDEEAEIKAREKYLLIPESQIKNAENDLPKNKRDWVKIIFVEKELNLEGVPVFEWRDFEVEKLAFKNAKTKIPNTKERDINDEILISGARIIGFKEGYKYNPAKYTESDLRNAMKMMMQGSIVDDEYYPLFSEDEIIQSLKKYPNHIMMESEGYCGSPYTTERCPKCIDSCDRAYTRLKLFTNSKGKQQGTVKELIWK
jgi:hypothetical protein